VNQRNLFITIEGPPGIGKTTLAKWLSKELNYKHYLEPMSGSVQNLRVKFYKDMKKWAFALQIKLFQLRFRQHQEILLQSNDIGAVQDRSIYGDKPFAYLLHQQGFINDDEILIYEECWEQYRHFIVEPDIMIFLEADVDTLIHRIKKERNRPEEHNITKEYLEGLIYYTNLLRNEKLEQGTSCFTFNWSDPESMKPNLLKFIQRTIDNQQYYYKNAWRLIK